MRQQDAAAHYDAARVDEERALGSRGIFLLSQDHPGDGAPLGDIDRDSVRQRPLNLRAFDLRQFPYRRPHLAEIDGENVSLLQKIRRRQHLLARQRAIGRHARLADKVIRILPDPDAQGLLAAEPRAAGERDVQDRLADEPGDRAKAALAHHADADFHVEHMLLLALLRAGDALVPGRFHVRRARESPITRAQSSA